MSRTKVWTGTNLSRFLDRMVRCVNWDRISSYPHSGCLLRIINLGQEDDPIIEYEDEFGRIRTARRSDVPRDRLPDSKHAEVPADDEYVPHIHLTDLPI